MQSACLDWLAAIGIFAWRNNSAGIYDPKSGTYRFPGLKGVPQTVRVVGHDEPHTFGNLLAIEVKRPGGRLTSQQAAFLTTVNERGGLGLCVRSLDELIEQITPCL